MSEQADLCKAMQRECLPSTDEPDYIVCGYYTPTYRPWWVGLRETLAKYNQPYEFTAVYTPPAGLPWEEVCLLKPAYIVDAMDKHPGKTIIWLDVDCTIHGDLSPMLEIPGDIALRFQIKAQRRRALVLRAHSGTMLIRPTEAAYRFVRSWQVYGNRATRGEDDETTLARAIVGTPGVAISQLHPDYFAGGGRAAPNPTIVHNYASRDARKVSAVARFLYRQLGVRYRGRSFSC